METVRPAGAEPRLFRSRWGPRRVACSRAPQYANLAISSVTALTTRHWHPYMTHRCGLRGNRTAPFTVSGRRPLIFACALAMLLCATASTSAQTGEYQVTAQLKPSFIHPATGENWNPSYPLLPLGGLVRGADGWLYGITRAGSVGIAEAFTIFRVNPATGVPRLLYAVTGYNPVASSFFRGREGRLYFTVVDGGMDVYEAQPGPYAAQIPCIDGCVLFLETANGGRTLERLHWFGANNEGHYPRVGISAEDTDGSIYVITSTGNVCRTITIQMRAHSFGSR